MRVEILEASVEFVHQRMRVPLVISSGSITESTEARATVTVEVNGRRATGRGTIYLSDVWAWPDPSRSHAERDAALRRLCEDIACNLRAWCGGEPAHPLELGLRLHHHVCQEPIPPALARAMCASPFDAAIHDATGLALGVSAFALYRDPTPLPSADHYFAKHDAIAAIQEVIQQPRRELPAWLLVNHSDSLEKDVAPWIKERGYHCFKLKIMGRDTAADVAQTVEAFRAVRRFGVRDPWLSIDSNCANPDAASVLDYLERLRATDQEAFAALQYAEQPTARDIHQTPHNWHAVARLKPVMLDEGLTGPDLLYEARVQGWSGFALKTCKGHSFALLAAAWAREQGMLLAMQDLTNPGLSLIHSALFAAHMPTINGVEANSPQFTPDANRDWLPRLAALFEPRDGTHRLPEKMPAGLGSQW